MKGRDRLPSLRRDLYQGGRILPSMPGKLSKNQVNRLGKRLRNSESVSQEDLQLLQQLRAAHADVLDQVAGILRDELGLEPTSRLKTVNTLVDKVKRERTMALSKVQDIAGIRVVLEGTRIEQDGVVDAISQRFPGSEVVDRRVNPSHGYRAVHVIVEVDDCKVEIQVRTQLQDQWAQTAERLGDRWGRQVRYGGEPDDAERPIGGPGSTTRRGVWNLLLVVSEQCHRFESAQGVLIQQGKLVPGSRDEFSRETEEVARLQSELLESLRDVVD